MRERGQPCAGAGIGIARDVDLALLGVELAHGRADDTRAKGEVHVEVA